MINKYEFKCCKKVVINEDNNSWGRLCRTCECCLSCRKKHNITCIDINKEKNLYAK